jgi:hypothetical protein
VPPEAATTEIPIEVLAEAELPDVPIGDEPQA